jgi:hypothetical protein
MGLSALLQLQAEICHGNHDQRHRFRPKKRLNEVLRALSTITKTSEKPPIVFPTIEHQQVTSIFPMAPKNRTNLQEAL